MENEVKDERFGVSKQAYDPDDLLDARLMYAVTDDGLTHLQDVSWRTDAPGLDALPADWTHVHGARRKALVSTSDGITVATFERGAVSAKIAAATQAGAESIVALLKELLPVAEQTDEHAIHVRFWALSPNGPLSVMRRLAAPPWQAVRGNYSGEVGKTLDAATRGFRPSFGGQLLLWHGEPGTGKTWAIRSLAWEWRDWCDTEYIVDPEQFFGAEGAYLMQVLLEGDSPSSPESDAPPRWRLLVMEDTGELLTVDAAERSGKALSRFLNVVDGFIGQGLRVLVLLTTNEHIDRLHPAVARPGRTAMELAYGRLNADEASAWAQRNGFTVPHRAHTLAELYAAAEARPRPQLVHEVGFGRAS